MHPTLSTVEGGICKACSCILAYPMGHQVTGAHAAGGRAVEEEGRDKSSKLVPVARVILFVLYGASRDWIHKRHSLRV